MLGLVRILNPPRFCSGWLRTVAPGFEFEHFELADRAHFLEKADQRSIIERLTSPAKVGTYDFEYLYQNKFMTKRSRYLDTE